MTELEKRLLAACREALAWMEDWADLTPRTATIIRELGEAIQEAERKIQHETRHLESD